MGSSSLKVSDLFNGEPLQSLGRGYVDPLEEIAGGPHINKDPSRAWVVPTDKEIMVAHHTRQLLRESVGKAWT